MKNSSRKIKVCILTSVHPVFDTRIFYKEAITLARVGYDVSLIAQHNKNEIVDGIKIIPLPKPKNRTERFLKTDFLLFKKALQQKADIYHFHDPELMPVGLFLKLLLKAKVIYDVHEDNLEQIPSKDWIPQFLGKIIGVIIGKIELFTSRNIDAIITVTPYLANKFKRTKKTVILYNFPSYDLFVNKNYKNTYLFDIIHIGTLSRSRIEFFYQVALELKKQGYKFKWCILGMQSDISNWAKKRLEQNDLSEIKGNFIFVDYVDHTEVIKYIKQSRIGINYHPAEKRLMTAIPVKIFEYMACGLPVVCSDLITIRDLLKDKNCAILVKTNDINGFVDAIGYLLSNPDVAKRLGDNGKQTIEKDYNWSTQKRVLLSLYGDLL